MMFKSELRSKILSSWYAVLCSLQEKRIKLFEFCIHEKVHSTPKLLDFQTRVMFNSRSKVLSSWNAVLCSLRYTKSFQDKNCGISG